MMPFTTNGIDWLGRNGRPSCFIENVQAGTSFATLPGLILGSGEYRRAPLSRPYPRPPALAATLPAPPPGRGVAGGPRRRRPPRHKSRGGPVPEPHQRSSLRLVADLVPSTFTIVSGRARGHVSSIMCFVHFPPPRFSIPSTP